MIPRLFAAAVVVLLVCNVNPVRADEPAVKRASTAELNDARRAGWQLALPAIENLKKQDTKDFPGVQSWLKDLEKATKGIDAETDPEKWPAIDVDGLLIRNPNFWQAYYEIAPADPGLMLLQAGLLLTAGEAVRATHLMVVARQRPGIPPEVQDGFNAVLTLGQQAGGVSNQLVAEGIALHDKQDYEGALRKYREAITAWPQNGFAYYEVGYTLFIQQHIAAGKKLPKPESITVNEGEKAGPKVVAAFAKSRQHDPFQIKAYQGDDEEVIRGFMALAQTGMAAWMKVARNSRTREDDGVLEQLASACQSANNHELALAISQVLVARRNGYRPADHPFITTSLRKLVPGAQTEQVLKRLSGGELRLIQLIAPVNEQPAEDDKQKAAHLKQIRLYIPIPELPERIKDVTELSDYIKALAKTASEVVARHDKPDAKGLLIAVGIKSGKKSHIWCQAIDGDMPDDLLRKLEVELAKIETVEPKKSPIAFGMDMVLYGQSPKQFPEFPDRWMKIAAESESKEPIPFDEVFKKIWPNEK